MAESGFVDWWMFLRNESIELQFANKWQGRWKFRGVAPPSRDWGILLAHGWISPGLNNWWVNSLRNRLFQLRKMAAEGCIDEMLVFILWIKRAELTENMTSQADLTVKVKLKVLQNFCYSKAAEQ
jgi:hypothetical protein